MGQTQHCSAKMCSELFTRPTASCIRKLKLFRDYNVTILCRSRHKCSRVRSMFKRVNKPWQVSTLTEENQYHRLADSVTPLYQIPYEEQLELKQEYIRESLTKVIGIGLSSRPRKSRELLERLSHLYDGQCCPLEDIKPSPAIYGYRNKEEFSVGCNIHGNRKTVGLYVGKGRRKNPVCVEPHHLVNISKQHSAVCKAYQDFIQSSDLPGCQVLHDGGNWRDVVLRSTTTKETMMVVRFHPQNLSEKDIEAAKGGLRECFASGPGKSLNLHSLYFQKCPRTYCSGTEFPHELLLGRPHIEERVLGMRFQISPDSFFQTNTAAAEVLYSTVLDYASLTPQSTVLDVYCGTGTIGILLSPGVKKVIGIEQIDQAVEDAKVNAEINNCTNAEFIPGDARKLMNTLFSSGNFDGEELVAVVNPGRMGMSLKGVRALKRCSAIRRLVFVTCKPHGQVLENFVDLCVDMEDISTEAFRPVKAVAVDMFPHTLHTELVMTGIDKVMQDFEKKYLYRQKLWRKGG